MAEQPKYLQVADILRKEIAEGVFRDGQTLLTEEELRFRFNVSRQTIRQAIALLEEDGLSTGAAEAAPMCATDPADGCRVRFMSEW